MLASKLRRGGDTPLRDALRPFRCKRCGGAPRRTAIVERADGDTQYGRDRAGESSLTRKPSPKTQPIGTAPRDGSWIVVYAGAEQKPIEAHWSRTLQGWVSREWVVQYRVTEWFPGATVHTPRITDLGKVRRR
jgi:hypothetical protein